MDKMVGNTAGGANSVTHVSTTINSDADMLLYDMSAMSMDDKDDDEMDTNLPRPGVAILPTELSHDKPNTMSNAPTQPAPATTCVSSPGLTTRPSPEPAALLPKPVATTPSAMAATSTAPATVTPPAHSHVTTTTITSTVSTTNSTATLAATSQLSHSAPTASSVAVTSAPPATSAPPPATNQATNTPAKKTAEAHMLNLQQKYLNMSPASRDRVPEALRDMLDCFNPSFPALPAAAVPTSKPGKSKPQPKMRPPPAEIAPEPEVNESMPGGNCDLTEPASDASDPLSDLSEEESVPPGTRRSTRPKTTPVNQQSAAQQGGRGGRGGGRGGAHGGAKGEPSTVNPKGKGKEIAQAKNNSTSSSTSKRK
ncbi:hypothetical protein FRC06_011099, partial [Ceratobasidium sp. 370]